MPASIFISFRTEDALPQARSLSDQLRRTFGDDAVFFDGRSVRGGESIPDKVREGVEGCMVLIAVIGPKWLSAQDPRTWERKLSLESDWVRQELTLAFARGKTVIPLLLDGAGDKPPPREALVDGVRDLADARAMTLHEREYEKDLGALVTRLEELGLEQRAPEAVEPEAASSRRASPEPLLAAIASAVVSELGDDDLALLTGARLDSLAQRLWDDWGADRSHDERAAELAAVARLHEPESRELARRTAGEAAPEWDDDRLPDLVRYLGRVRPTIRRHLRRNSDLAGTSIPQLTTIESGKHLARFLPQGKQRFKEGDRPLADSDLVLEELLGIGGFCEVWRAADPHVPDSEIALKICNDEQVARDLLDREHRINALTRAREDVELPGLVPLKRSYLRADPPCLEYELVDGGDLIATAEAWPAKERVERATETIQQLARILAPLHTELNLVHRDLKPANILVTKTGELKVIDLGIAALAERTDAASPAVTMLIHRSGTLDYMSPEQKEGEPVDARDDVYALGVIWYQLVLGNLSASPRAGKALRRQLNRTGLQQSLSDLLEDCLEEREHRPDHAADLLERLVATAAPALSAPATVGSGSSAPEIEGFQHVSWFEEGAYRVPVYAYLPFVEALQGRGSVDDADCQFVLVPSGSFDREDESTRQSVDVPGFLLARTQVTQRIWSGLARAGLDPTPSHFKGERLPVEQVTWHDVRTWCEGLGLRLPSEAEWEHACRGGSDQRFCFGDDQAELPRYAWFNENTDWETYQVATREPNSFGLYDMHGNVWEWCEDSYGDYSAVPTDGRAGIDDHAPYRVVRGGSWYDVAQGCRSADRGLRLPEVRYAALGFRPATSYP